MPTILIDDTFNIGNREGSSANAYEIHFYVEVDHQDITANKSYLNITKTYKGIHNWAWNQTSGTDTISGAVSSSVSISQIYPTNTVITVQSLSNVPVSHNSDGTLTTTINTGWTYGSVYNKYMVKEYSKSYDVTLPTIARASNISLSASSININSTSGSVSYTITPYSSAFTHSLTWGFGSNTATISNATSGSLTYSQLLGKLTTATSGTLTLTLTTYNNGAAIGSKTATASVTIDTSVIKPSVSLGNIVVDSSPISGYLVAGYSSAKITSTATASTGATVLTRYTTSHGNLNRTSSPSTSPITVTTDTLPGSADNYTLTISATATDSRGVTATASKTKTVYAYSKPKATLIAYRTATNASSDTTQDDSGQYVYVTFSGALGDNSSVNGQNSILASGGVVCTYTIGSTTNNATNGAHYSLAETQSATFTLTVTDKVSSSTRTVVVGTASFPLDLYDNGAGNVGVGLGGIASSGYISPYLPFNDQIKTSFNQSVAMGSYQAASTTVPDLVNELRFSSGVMGSVSIGTAYTSGAVTIVAGWYNFIYSPHRSGGVNGTASRDNCNYGSLILIGMTGFFGMYRIRISSAAIAEVNRVCETPIQFFYSVSNVGETVGSPTVATVFNAMPNRSMLICDVTDFASAQRPTEYGTVQIYRQTNSRGWIMCFGKGPSPADYRMYLGSSGGPNGIWLRTSNNSYTTSEVDTGGTWVDGKVIYKKTLSYNNAGIGNGTTWSHNIANINEVVKVEGHLNNDGTYIGFPNTTNNSANDLGFRVSKTQIQWFGNDSWGANTNRTIYITIYYTKT